MPFRLSRAAVLATAIGALPSPACELIAPLTPVPPPADGSVMDRAAVDAGPVTISRSGTPCTSAEAAMAFPATPILDHFDGPSGAVDPSHWIGFPGSFEIGGGHLVEIDPDRPLFWNAALSAQQEVYAKFSVFDPLVYDIRLSLKAQNPNAANHVDAECDAFYIEFSISNGNGIVTGYCANQQNLVIDYAVGGDFAIRPGDELGARIFSDGCVVVLVNRQPFLLTSTGGFPFNDRTGYIGVYSQFTKDGSGGIWSEWDDFGGGSLP